MKRILALCIVLSVFVVMLFGFDVNAENINYEQSETVEVFGETIPLIEQTTMVRLGILPDNIDFSSEITRSDLAIVFYKINNYKNRDMEVSTLNQIFLDVNIYDGLAGYVEYLYGADIISGYSDGTYRPDDKVYAMEAYSMALKSAGYSDYLVALGNYSQNVSVAASKANFKTDISFENPLTFSDLSKVLYRLMFTRIMEPVSYKEGSASYDERGLFLEEKMKLAYDDGIITSVGKYSIDGKVAKNTNLCIDGTEYITSEIVDYVKYPGTRVRYYYDEDKVITAVCLLKNQNITTLNYNGLSYNNNYYKDENEKKYYLDDGYKLTYNERFAENSVNMIPEYGYVQLIDYDDDGRNEVVNIYDFNVILVKFISQEKSITAIDNNGGIEIKLDSYDEYTVKDQNGSKAEVSNVNNGYPCLVAESMDNSYVFLIPILNKVVGNVKSISDDIIEIDDKEYNMSSKCFSETWENDIGVDVTAYTDFLGNIVYIKDDSVPNFQYGFVIRSATDGNKLNDETQIKLLKQTGNIEILILDEKVKINGKRQKNENVASKIGNEVLIRYKEKDGLITDILLPEDCDFNNSQNISATSDHLLRRASGTVYFKGWSAGLKKHGTMLLAGDVIPNNGIVIFGINPDTSLSDEDRYRVINIGTMDGERDYEVDAFNSSVDDIRIDAMVLKSYDGMTTIASPFIVVDKVIASLNEQGDGLNKLCGYQNGAYKEYFVKDDSVIRVGRNRKITQGDIVVPVINHKNEITSLTLLYSEDGLGQLNSQVATDTNFNASKRFITGYIQKKNANTIVFRYENDKYPIECFNIGVPISFIDMNQNNSKLRVGILDNISMIKDIENYEKGDRVVIQTKESAVRAVAVIKE